MHEAAVCTVQKLSLQLLLKEKSNSPNLKLIKHVSYLSSITYRESDWIIKTKI